MGEEEKMGNTGTTGTLRKWKTEKPKVKKVKIKKSREKKMEPFFWPGSALWIFGLKK